MPLIPSLARSLRRAMVPRLHWLLAVAFVAVLPGVAGAQNTEIVRGKVIGADGKPVPDVTVTITGLQSQEVKSPHTNEKGIYTALFTNGDGDYLVNVRKIGYSPYNTRLTRTGLSSVLSADVTLTQIAYELDTLSVLAKRAQVKGDEASIGGVETNLLQGALFSLDPGDLASLAGQIPGILALGDSGFSVLGADASQNNTTVDGAKFGGARVPQDAIQSSRLIQTSTDPGVAGFGGGQTALILRGGSDLFSATARANFSDHHLAWSDPSYPRPVPQITGISGTIGGPIIKKRLHYQGSWNIRDQASDVYSLLDPPTSIISQYGLTLDTISAVSNALHQLGVPLTAKGFSPDQQNRNYNTSLVLDWTPKPTTAIRITHSGSWGNGGSPGSAPYSYPALGSSNDNTFQFLTGKLTGYVHGFLDELNMSGSYNRFASDPFLDAPSASVRVGTVFDDGHTGLGSLSFGGGSGVNRNSGYDWDTRNEFSWVPGAGKHRVKIGQEIDYSWATSYSSGNQFGSYSYQTLNDLAANRPASYSLTLSSFERSSKGATGSLWVGDEFAASKALQFQGGLRYDAAFPGTTPELNPDVQTAFGIRTNQIPHSRLLTPRLGFSWASAKRRGMGSPTGQGGPISLGSLPANLPPEFIQALLGTPRGSVAPGWAVNGSIGAYGAPLDNGSIASLIDQTGLPQTRRILTCVGDATPIPDWSAIDNAAPTSCLDGTGSQTFSSNVPSVRVYDPSYKASVNYRASLGIDGIRLIHNWTLGITAFGNYGVNGGSSLDLNLTQTPKFFLPDEADRAVFVSPDAIVPSTGVIAPNAYRINTAYGAVSNVVSDLRNYTVQPQFTIAPPHPLLHNKLNLSMTYIYNYSRREQRGMSGGGFGGGGSSFVVFRDGASFSGFGGGGSYAIGGNPFTKGWVPGPSPTHQISTNISYRAWWFNITSRINVYSGSPFTPSVNGDVNGDGLNDDLAFIPNPMTTTDPALAAQMTQLLASAPAGARACLMKQLGEVAGINSCSSQWQARLDLRLDFQPPRSFGFGDRLRLTTQMQNTSGAIVRLFGLENTPLGRGALSQQVQNQLLYVTGFNPTTQHYTYQVNQLFGQPTNFGNARRQYPPFSLQLGLEYKLGGPATAPMARSMGLIPGNKEPPYTMDQIHDKLTRLSRDPVQQILVRKDSMGLNRDQVTKLEAISKEFRARTDSALDPVLDYVMKKGRKIDDGQLQSRLGKAQPQIQRMLLDAQTRARALLTPAQLQMLPVTKPPAGMNAPAGRPSGAGAAGGGSIDAKNSVDRKGAGAGGDVKIVGGGGDPED
jgi:hypothetical protein